MYVGLHVSTRYFCHILMKIDFSLQIFENIRIPNFMKIRPVAAGLFHADGRTKGQRDRHEETSSRFSHFRERA